MLPSTRRAHGALLCVDLSWKPWPALSLSFPVVFKLFVQSFPSVTEMTIHHHENRTFDTMPLTLDSSHAPAPYVTPHAHIRSPPPHILDSW
jgi:hypothetical protein